MQGDETPRLPFKKITVFLHFLRFLLGKKNNKGALGIPDDLLPQKKYPGLNSKYYIS